MEPARDFSDRHPSTREKLYWLVPNPHLPTGTPHVVAAQFYDMALGLVSVLQDGPQITIALQHLMDAKDAAVRQAIWDSRG